VQELTGYFEIRIGQLAAGVAVGDYFCRDIRRELHAPYSGRYVFVPTEPDPAGAKCAGVTEPYIVEFVGHELADMGGSTCELGNEHSGVEEGMAHVAVASHSHKVW
jgi:hypothetical protein